MLSQRDLPQVPPSGSDEGGRTAGINNSRTIVTPRDAVNVLQPFQKANVLACPQVSHIQRNRDAIRSAGISEAASVRGESRIVDVFATGFHPRPLKRIQR